MSFLAAMGADDKSTAPFPLASQHAWVRAGKKFCSAWKKLGTLEPPFLGLKPSSFVNELHKLGKIISYPHFSVSSPVNSILWWYITHRWLWWFNEIEQKTIILQMPVIYIICVTRFLLAVLGGKTYL